MPCQLQRKTLAACDNAPQEANPRPKQRCGCSRRRPSAAKIKLLASSIWFFRSKSFTHQLDDSPDRDDQAAQWEFRSTNWHLVVVSNTVQLVEFWFFNYFLNSTKWRKVSDNHVTKKRGNWVAFSPVSTVDGGENHTSKLHNSFSKKVLSSSHYRLNCQHYKMFRPTVKLFASGSKFLPTINTAGLQSSVGKSLQNLR